MEEREKKRMEMRKEVRNCRGGRRRERERGGRRRGVDHWKRKGGGGKGRCCIKRRKKMRGKSIYNFYIIFFLIQLPIF